MKTVSDRIFELLKERKMSQKEFSKKTGIAESTISDWKKKRTNPVSDKILIICEVESSVPREVFSGDITCLQVYFYTFIFHTSPVYRHISESIFQS